MQHWQHVLAAIDLSDGDEAVGAALSARSLAAFDQALWVGRTCGAKLSLVAVVKTPLLSTVERIEANADDDVMQRARRHLDVLSARAEEAGVAAECRVVSGHPAQDLLRDVLQQSPDVVVMAAQDEAAVAPCIGGTALQVVRKSPVPVWLVQPPTAHDPQTFLVADDLTPVGLEALRLGVAAAHLMSARLVVLHAVDLSGEEGQPSDADLHETDPEQRRSDAERAVIERLHGTDYRTIGPGVQVHVRSGSPGNVLEAALAEFDVDLLLLGVQGEPVTAGMRLGKTLESLLPHVGSSVLAVKPEGFVGPAPADAGE